MEHLSPGRIAALASDPDDAPTPDEQTHLERCLRCRRESDELADLVREVRLARPTALRGPGPGVWAGVERQLAEEQLVSRRRSRVRRTWLVPIAAAVGVVVGVGATLGVRAVLAPDRSSVVASTNLAPLPGEGGAGTAQLVRAGDALQLRVHVSLTSSPSDDFHEVWLINGDGRRMYALGVLPTSGDASYWLPGALRAQLDGYSTVDVSLEPEDGNSAHSGHSLVRGQLPG